MNRLALIRFVLMTIAATRVLACTPAGALAAESAPAKLQRPLDESVPAPDPGMLTAEVFCARADRLLEEESRASLTEARALLEEMIRHFPNEVCMPAALSRALSALYLRRFIPDDNLIGAAVESAKAAVALAPGSPRALAALALAMMNDLQPAAAADAARQALSLAPDDTSVLRATASVLMALGDLPAARKAALHAVTLRPEIPVHHHILGNIHYMSGVESDAIVSYRSALALDSGHAASLVQLAAAYDQSGAHRTAGGFYKEALVDHPHEAGRVHVAMARSLMKGHGWSEALDVLSRAEFSTRRRLGQGSLFHLRAICHEQLGNFTEARSAFRKVVDEYPDATGGSYSMIRLADDAWEGLARIELKEQNSEAAAATFERGCARPEAAPPLLIALARFYRTYNLPTKALEAYERAVLRLQLFSDSAAVSTAYVEWARLAVARNDSDSLDRLFTSLAATRLILERVPDDLVDLEIARALSIAGRGEDAVWWLARAVERGYHQIDWISGDEEMKSVAGSRSFADLRRRVEASAHTSH